MINSPASETELLARAKSIAGLSLQALAQSLQYDLPTDFQHHKGWLGLLLELALGATAGSAAEPDFPDLSIELKTVPVNAIGKPQESTFVCTVPNQIELQWRDSVVYHKMKKVLWVPVEMHKPIPERCIGMAVLATMTPEQETILQQDWLELTEALITGHADSLTAKYGQMLQIRPKAANSSIVEAAIDAEGNPTKIMPRGFYLRTDYTAAILEQYYL